MKQIEKLKASYAKLYEGLQNEIEDLDQEVLDLEKDVWVAIDVCIWSEHFQMKGLIGKIKAMKKEFDLCDEESELDRMFPKIHEEGFDADSMS